MNRLLRIVLLLWLLAAGTAYAQFKLPGLGSDDLLPPERAFRFAARALDERSIEVSYTIAEGYYLYRDRFKFALQPGTQAKLGAPELPRGLKKTDQFFGEVETYRKELRFVLPLERPAGAQELLLLTVTSQGCADVGVCYTPHDSSASIRLAQLDAPGEASRAPASPPSSPLSSRLSLSASDLDVAKLFEGNIALVLASFVAFGLLLAFTPCVLPMIPILSGIIIGEGEHMNRLRALVLSLAYVFGMAIAYAAAGIAAAYSGSLIAAALQNAWVLGAFALVFVVLSLSMFGLYELRMPSFLHHGAQRAHQRLRGGQIASVAVMGLLSAVIVSPCVAAPLAGALLYISQTGDVALGGAALFSMALGMGLPLIVVGVSEGALLPKAGTWLLAVKKFIGVLLLAVAIWIISPLISVPIQMGLWAALLISGAVFLRAIDPLPPSTSGWRRFGKALGVLSLLIGAAMLVGALTGSRDPLNPLGGLMTRNSAPAAATNWVRVASLSEVEERVRAAGRPVMLDFYADWCVSCKEMESFTFSDPKVRAKLDRMVLLQADVTANSEDHKRLLKRFSLFGPPGTVFFDAQGREISGVRVIGYQSAEQFLRTLERAAPSN